MVRSVEAFTELAREVDHRWRACDHDERAFPEIARAVLADRRLDHEVSADDLLSWVLDSDQLPPQLDPESKFGQPPITVVREPRFVIDALFWMDGATEVHQHGFAGAFQVLTGSSVHARYDWALHERVSSAILIGETKFRGHELLSPGDTRPISPGGDLVHALFHLERPSVTIVVRTLADRECGPQYTYHVPHVATDPHAHDPVLQRQLESLVVLKRLGRNVDATFATLLARVGFHAVFRLGIHYLNHGDGGLGRLRELLEYARPRHGTRIDALPPVFDELLRANTIRRQREQLATAEHRFFLAMLLNLPSRSAILEAIQTRHPGDPVDRVVGWIDDISGSLGGLGSHEHRAVVVAEMLRGHSGERLLARLKAGFAIDDVRGVVELEQKLREAAVLRTLFVD